MIAPLHPHFLEHLQMQLGAEAPALIATITDSKAPVSIRTNPKKPFQFPTEWETQPVPWCSSGYYLAQRPSFTFDPLFHAGCYYVQEASSMFLSEVLQQTTNLAQPLKVFDLCAAPGGKSTLLLSMLSPDSLLVANEPIAARATVLVENCMRWGNPNVVVTNNDPEHFTPLQGFFDVVLVDAPCSGEGMFRKDPEAIAEWSTNNVKLCAARQSRILNHAAALVAPGGLLIYSTCTFNKQENEAHFDELKTDFEGVKLSLPANSEIVESNYNDAYGYRFYPNKVQGEGFFIACFRKSPNTQKRTFNVGKDLLTAPSKNQLQTLQQWIDLQHNLKPLLWKETCLLVPESIKSWLWALMYSKLYLKLVGIDVGKFYRDELVPAQHLALTSIVSENVPKANLNYKDAIAYLQKKDVKFDLATKGWQLASYQNHALGWIKALSNRINNYYPKEWRIRKEL